MRSRSVRHLRGSFLAAAVAMAFTAGAPCPVDAGSVAVVGSETPDAFRASVRSSLSRVKEARATALGYAPQMATGKPVMLGLGRQTSLRAEDGASDADLAWARAGLATAALAEQFGAALDGREVAMRRESDRFYISVDGVGGAWFDSEEVAQAYLFRALIGAGRGVAGAGGGAADDEPSFDSLVSGATEATIRRVVVPRGRETVLRIESENLADGTPTVVGPPGMRPVSVTRSGATILVTLRTDSATQTGLGTLSIYNPGHSFRAAETFPLMVTDGPDNLQPLIDKVPATMAGAVALPLGAPAAGTIEGSGDEDLYRVSVDRGGRLTVTTAGPTDVTVRVEDEFGVTIGAADDGAGWYNARLSLPVGQSGNYFVRVRHCCRGTGDYSLDVRLD